MHSSHAGVTLWLTCDFALALAALPADAAEELTTQIFLQLMACEGVINLKRLTDRAPDPELTRWATGILKLQVAAAQLAYLETIVAVLRSHLPLPAVVMIHLETQQHCQAVPLTLTAAGNCPEEQAALSTLQRIPL